MARTNSSFKLSKDAKRILATFTDPQHRSQYKKLMIDAEYSYTANRHRRSVDKPKNDSEQ